MAATPPQAAPGTPKAIVVFSDGTGNSAAKLNKTNVWRVYRALDLATPSAAGPAVQIALYDDGVGTSGFRPLALLGGAFGWGLKRNVLDLYKFLCRNYRPGDRLYAFGFSRGAFTIRVLMGLVLRIGLVPYEGEQRLACHAEDAYRLYRRGFKASFLSGLFRNLRDAAVGAWRKLRGTPVMPPAVAVDEVEFVGVWDTVAAYGMPLAEMTRAVDRWIWPLSMPNYALSPKVKRARHALALDDERDTFHPLLWDEVAESKMVAARQVAPGRLQQVWFAGMHSDVGGGYPDDSLSYVSLDWMMGEAAAAGLRFKQGARQAIVDDQNALGPMHDSRMGLGSYYRYQPRRLSARLEPPDPHTLLMQDPDPPHGRLLDVVVHESVMQRIGNGPDGYAPIALPPMFSVRAASGQDALVELAPGTERVWNLVWRRRITYFFGLAVTLLFLLMPQLPVSDCDGPQCLVAPAVSAAGGLLPDFLRPWVKAWADNPAVFLVLVVAMIGTLAASRALQRAIDDTMSAVWQQTLAGTPGASPSLGGIDAAILKLRTSRLYQRTIQRLKWRVAPAILAWAFLLIVVIAVVVLAHRVPLAFIDVHAKYCASAPSRAVGAQPTQAQGSFSTLAPCWTTGLAVEKDVPYRLTLTVTAPWSDDHGRIPTTPEGFASSRLGVVAPIAAPLRRSTSALWFQPVVTLRDAQARSHTFAVPVRATTPLQGASPPASYSGTFTAPATGEAFLFVNDVVLPWWPADHPRFYDNNRGTAQVTLERLPHVNKLD